MIKVVVAGACGRMGYSVIKALSQSQDLKLVGTVESPENPNIGRDSGEACGIGSIGIQIKSSSELTELLKEHKPDALVDFTNAKAAVENATSAAKVGINLVIGTTGFDEAQRRKIDEVVKKAGISAVVSPNMATGVNVFFKLARDAAGILEGYDIEIIEAHHKHKKDSPSGTAIRVGELIAKEIGKNLGVSAIYGRKGTEERKQGEIGFHAIRAGDIVGEHTVLLAGDGERIEITHRAHGREAFANGALKAVRFLQGKKDGRVYTTWDVLGIE